MRITCLCGNPMSNTATTNRTEHHLLDAYGIEYMQDLIDRQICEDGIITLWPENWRESGVIDVWKCAECERLYVMSPDGERDKVKVYKIERIGI